MRSDYEKDGVQFVESGFWPEPRLSSEQKLLLAIIDRAVQDAYATKTNGMESARVHPHLLTLIRDEARRWLAASDHHPLSFRWCCDMLNLDYRMVTTQAIRHNFRGGRFPDDSVA